MTLQSDSASQDDERPMQLPSPCPPLFPGPGRSGTATPQQQSHSGFFKQFTTTGGENVGVAHVIDREQVRQINDGFLHFFRVILTVAFVRLQCSPVISSTCSENCLQERCHLEA